MQAISQLPPTGSAARFAPQFGRRFIVTVDTEDEVDSGGPPRREGHGLEYLPRLAKFQSFCESEGVVPVYLLDWPVATSSLAIDILAAAAAAGKAEIGLQLRAWANPPFDDEETPLRGFSGDTPRELEAAKLGNLRRKIEENFGVPPLIHRAERYRAGPHTAELLRDLGMAIDTSVRSNFDYSAEGGPDYRRHPLAPYWLDAEKSLLELPPTSVYWGLLRRQGVALFPRVQRRRKLADTLSHLGLLERIALSPEGVSVEAAIRGIDIALDDGLRLLGFSFHGPSLHPASPHMRSERDLDDFYDWWRRVFDYCALREVRPTTIGEIMASVER